MGSSMALALAGFGFSVLFIVFVCTRLACALLRRTRRRGSRSRLSAAADPELPQHYHADPEPFPFHGFRFRHHHAAAAAGATAAASPGLDPAAVAAFPTRVHHAAAHASDSDSVSDDGDSQCVICLAEYEEKDMLRILPYCSHNFHMACIDLWLEQNSTCPVCRISLLVLDNPESEHTAPPPAPPLTPLSSIVISPPSSPESSRSDPCSCLFVSSGHSSRASEAPPRHEPDQENQVVSGPSVDGANSLPLSEVNPPPENNNSQTVRKQVDRSTQLGPCK